MPFTQEAFEFWLHVEERLTIIKDRTFVELSPLLGISSESSPATVSVRLEKEWKEPLAEIVNRLNEHPIMMGCPPARLVTKGEGERFRFAIEFS